MKILITTDVYAPTINGVVISVMSLRQELLKRGHEVKVLTLSMNRHGYEEDGVVYLGAAGAGKIYPDARFTLPRESRYVEELIAWGPEVIHTQSEFSTYFIAKKISSRLNIPMIHTYHTIYEDYTHYFSPVKSWGREVVSMLSNRVLKNMAYVVAPSEKVRGVLHSYDVASPIAVIPTGIDMTRFNRRLDQEEMDSLKDQYGIKAYEKVILFVGRLAKEKNLGEIIDFFKRMQREDTVLLIVGDGPNREELSDLADGKKDSARVIFTGMVPHDDVWKFYQLGDVFVSASSSETQGLTYFEAMANGLAVVCRRDPCLDDVVISGVNGWQYTSYDEFSHHIEEVLKGEDSSYGIRAFEHIKSRYSLEAFGEQIEGLYEMAIMGYMNRDRHSFSPKVTMRRLISSEKRAG